MQYAITEFGYIDVMRWGVSQAQVSHFKQVGLQPGFKDKQAKQALLSDLRLILDIDNEPALAEQIARRWVVLLQKISKICQWEHYNKCYINSVVVRSVRTWTWISLWEWMSWRYCGLCDTGLFFCGKWLYDILYLEINPSIWCTAFN